MASLYPGVALLRTADAESEPPFDASGETARLMKIHDLAEEMVAREAAGHVGDLTATTAVGGGLRGSGAPAARAKSSPDESFLMTLAESSLMPLADAADSSVRASVHKTSATESPTSREVSSGNSALLGSQAAATSAGDSAEQSSSTAISQQSSGRRRKPTPHKSPGAEDPNFKGAVVHMRLLMVRGQPQLRMDHYFK
ncbi:hypothetical protein V5799_013732 [Amblyomma americanum]|uniref:Uncharacterized protein n=1 Tax=Amblyomma americanum TaxID=6943 RepID=A0AAQ4E585_AMBAM